MKNLLLPVRQLGSRAVFFVKENQSTIKVVAGIGLGIAGAVKACKATIKAKDIWEDHKSTMDLIQKSAENEELKASGEYTETDKRNDTILQTTMTATKLVKTYAVPVGLGLAGIGLILNGHSTQCQKTAVALNAVNTLQTALASFKSKATEQLGNDIVNQMNVDTIEVENTNPETGEQELIKAVSNVRDPYSRFYEDGRICKICYANIMDDLGFCQCKQDEMTNKLRARGYLLLNDVYEELGFDKTLIGNYVGWVYDMNDPRFANYVDFDAKVVKRFTKDSDPDDPTLEEAILLNFNVDGPIMDEIIKRGLINKF